MFGADALRFTLARGASPGGDLSVGEDHVRASRNFGTKLFNATRFAMINGAQLAPLPALAELTDADRWILGRLEEVRAEVDSAFDGYEFSRACEALYHFAWDEFCDWYVELAKTQLADGLTHTTAVLAAVLDTLLRLLHPVIPFITEALWQALTAEESLVIAEWPKPSGIVLDLVAAQRITDMQKLVTEVRRFRSDQGLADRQKVPARLAGIGDCGPEHPGGRGDVAGVAHRAGSGLPRLGVLGGSARRVAPSSSNSTPRAPSMSPPSAAAWKRIWPQRKRSWRRPPPNWPTRTFWPRRPSTSSPRSATVSGWPQEETERINARLAGLQ